MIFSINMFYSHQMKGPQAAALWLLILATLRHKFRIIQMNMNHIKSHIITGYV